MTPTRQPDAPTPIWSRAQRRHFLTGGGTALVLPPTVLTALWFDDYGVDATALVALVGGFLSLRVAPVLLLIGAVLSVPRRTRAFGIGVLTGTTVGGVLGFIALWSLLPALDI
jgi:hypothetical protein